MRTCPTAVLPRRVAAAVMVALFAALPFGAARAQSAAPLTPGDWVRATPRGAGVRVEGRVFAADSAAFSLRAEHPALALELRYADLASLDRRISSLSRGRSAASGAGTGLLIGLGVGAAATVATALSNADENCDDCFFSPTASMAVLGAAFAVASTTVGAIIGAAHPRERWQRVKLPARVGVAPIAAPAGRVGLALATRF